MSKHTNSHKWCRSIQTFLKVFILPQNCKCKQVCSRNNTSEYHDHDHKSLNLSRGCGGVDLMNAALQNMSFISFQAVPAKLRDSWTAQTEKLRVTPATGTITAVWGFSSRLLLSVFLSFVLFPPHLLFFQSVQVYDFYRLS